VCSEASAWRIANASVALAKRQATNRAMSNAMSANAASTASTGVMLLVSEVVNQFAIEGSLNDSLFALRSS
jgi:hypothetical protein